MFVALVALIWLLECWGRIPSSGVSVWYMHSHPKWLRLLFVVQSAWRCLVWSSSLSVPFPVTGPFTWVLVYSSLSLSHLGLSVTGAQVRGPGVGGSWLGCGVLAPWGVIAIAAARPLGHLTSTCDVGVNNAIKTY